MHSYEQTNTYYVGCLLHTPFSSNKNFGIIALIVVSTIFFNKRLKKLFRFLFRSSNNIYQSLKAWSE